MGLEGGGKLGRIGDQKVMVEAGEFFGEAREPEVGELGEDAAFVRDGGGHDDVEGGEAIRGDDEEGVVV